jgi:hypothetical protein
MNQFVVPQFIDVEDKIFGPITTRQFLIILVGGIIIFLGFRFGDLGLFILDLLLVGGLTLIFAFVKVNGQAFHYFILNIAQTLRKPSLRIWQKNYSNADLNYFRKIQVGKKMEDEIIDKKVRRPHIRDLSLIVNTGGYYGGDSELQTPNSIIKAEQPRQQPPKVDN